MEKFHDMMEGCGLEDIGYWGNKFTWSNNRSENSLVLERLDRALVSSDWMRRFPTTCISHLVSIVSNHVHMALHSSELKNSTSGKKRSLRFDAMWIRHVYCVDVVKNARALGTTSEPLSSMLAVCLQALQWSNRTTFGHVQQTLKKKHRVCLKTNFQILFLKLILS
ncbi:uncharacterized protein LOC120007326 [Tripterygium wilfordii]|uniref:uncharacterized protein LOC120007326 n=1 Tax=Tripterygium wilfordii TaxID=458696 RepID=UPI0018F86452|nr:uncharacterized protein LOC120007326 [Tripterygium wilfordii]